MSDTMYQHTLGISVVFKENIDSFVEYADLSCCGLVGRRRDCIVAARLTGVRVGGSAGCWTRRELTPGYESE